MPAVWATSARVIKVFGILANAWKDEAERSEATHGVELCRADPILEELEKEGRIRIDANMISSK